SDKLGQVKYPFIKLPLKPGFRARKQKPYKIKKVLEEKVNEAISDLERRGGIKLSTSPYSSPLVAVIKGDGTIRITVNYSEVNQGIEDMAYPLPDMEKIIEKIQGKKFVSTIDAWKSFWQLGLAEEFRKYTAFQFGDKLYEHTVLPMGLKC